jgi:hypothetical protein
LNPEEGTQGKRVEGKRQEQLEGRPGEGEEEVGGMEWRALLGAEQEAWLKGVE